MIDTIDTQKRNERLLYIDWAKFWGIYLVILGHLNISNFRINLLINSCHMQLFFFLSGLCFKHDNNINNFKKNVKALLLPYLSFQILCYPYWFLRNYFQNHVDMNRIDYCIKPLLGFLYGIVSDTKYTSMIIGATWFLLSLFCIKTIANILIDINYMMRNIILIFLIIISILVKSFGIMLPWSLNSSFLCLPIFLLGYYCKDYIKIIIQQNIKLKLFYIVILFIVYYSLTEMNGLYHVGDGLYGNNIVLYYINALTGSLIIILLSSLFNKMNNYISVLSRNTLIIMCMEVYIYAPFKLVYTRLYHINPTNQEYMPLLVGLVIALISLFLSYIPCWFINRYIPFCIGKTKRGIK